MNRSILAFAVPAFLILTVPLQAGPIGKPGAPTGKGQGPGRDEIRKRFDQDGDGKLSPQEMSAARQAMQARAIPGKGGLGQVGNGSMRDAVMKRFDKDGDGKLNDDERAAARKAMDNRRNK